jgi:murein DD-endopeptidase MepM/ murein hydrolase activator NlpD
MNNKDMKKLLSAFSFLLSPLFLFAQQPFIDIDENAQNRIMAAPIQSCDFDIDINLNKILVIEDEKQLPAFGLYNNHWDTLFIRSEKIDIPFYDNQLKINLVQDGNNPFAFPVSSIVLTNFIKNKGKQHTGIDFAILKKEPVVSCFDGVVRVAKKYEEYGNTVVIRQFNGLETVYALLDLVCVFTGQQVKAGDLIAYISNTSDIKRNVLHFETRFLNEIFNPEKMISFTERKLKDNILVITPTDFISVPIVSPIPSVITDSEKEYREMDKEENGKQQSVYHSVQKGDTIIRICAKYGISEKQLRILNSIKGDHIELGQKLRIQ